MRITGIALAILSGATVENLEILRRGVIVSVKVWLLRRWRLAQGFLRIAEPQRREKAMRRVGRVIVGEAVALFAFTAFFLWQAAANSDFITYKDPVGDRLRWIFLAVITLGGGLACLVARLLIWRFKRWGRQILIIEAVALFALTALFYRQGSLYGHLDSIFPTLLTFGGATALIIASLIILLSNINTAFTRRAEL